MSLTLSEVRVHQSKAINQKQRIAVTSRHLMVLIVLNAKQWMLWSQLKFNSVKDMMQWVDLHFIIYETLQVYYFSKVAKMGF